MGVLLKDYAGIRFRDADAFLRSVFRTIFPRDIAVDPGWMVIFTFFVEFDVLSTTLLLWGRAGAGAATESNPFMGAIVHEPLLHFGLKLLFALFTITIANILEHNIRGYGTKIIKVACVPYIFTFIVNFFWLAYTVKLMFFGH